MRATDGSGVDLVVNTVGGSVFAECVRCLAFEGRLGVVGYVDGVLHADIDLQALHAKRLTLFGVSNKMRTAQQRTAAIPAFSADLLPAFSTGRIAPFVDRVFPFAQLEQARAHGGQPARRQDRAGRGLAGTTSARPSRFGRRQASPRAGRPIPSIQAGLASSGGPDQGSRRVGRRRGPGPARRPRLRCRPASAPPPARWPASAGKRSLSPTRRRPPRPPAATRWWIRPWSPPLPVVSSAAFWVNSRRRKERPAYCIHFAPASPIFGRCTEGPAMKFRFPIVIIDEDFRSENTSGLGIRALAAGDRDGRLRGAGRHQLRRPVAVRAAAKPRQRLHPVDRRRGVHAAGPSSTRRC